jgi:hypothetical protein
MSTTLNPCHCGYQGELEGVDHQGTYLSLTCPECNREVTAFTAPGLVEAWNKPDPVEKLAGPVALSVWYGPMPESNGKSNFTAILHRKGQCISEGITIDRSEYPERVRYEADRLRFLIGELTEEPFILDYDADAHSGYKRPVELDTVAAERDRLRDALQQIVDAEWSSSETATDFALSQTKGMLISRIKGIAREALSVKP